MRRWIVVALVSLVVSASFPARAAGRGEPGPVFAVRIELLDRDVDRKLLHDLDIDVDGVFGHWARAYVIAEEVEKLTALGFALSSLPPDDGTPWEPAPPEALVPSAYHTYETLTSELQSIAAAYPNLTRLVSIGKSVQGRDLWVMKITDNPGIEEDEPEVGYIAAMHGDEVVGKEMCVNLINHLTQGYGSDPRATALVDDFEIWVLPSMNPDGTALSRRYNANFVDLNRDFPDQFVDPVDTTAGREVETAAVMNWARTTYRSLSANFHGGALVANYPWDGTPTGASTYSLCPDDSPFVSVSRTYADDNPALRASNADPSFNNGICNGADWYAISGGMQDWNYIWLGNFEITLEISGPKWPAANTLPSYWNDNLESMLSYFERARGGLRGVVTAADTGLPLAATVKVQGNAYPTRTDPALGDWHRLALPGLYALEIAAPGYATKILDGVEPADPAARFDVALEPLAPAVKPLSGCVPAGGGCDGWLSPGETSDLKVQLRNLGVGLTGISATLVPTTWSAMPSQPVAAYGDLAAGAAGESIAPHHTVSVDPGAPAGHKVGFALAWSAAQGSGISEPFFVPVDAASCTVVAASNVPVAILDRQTASSTLSFPGTFEIDDVRVTVDIAHTYKNDLRVDVVSPGGTAVALHNRTGGSADNVIGTFGTGGLAPFEPLSRLDGESSQGTWSLKVNDGVPTNTGTIRNWSIEVCGRPFEAATPAMKIREVARNGAGATVTWWPYPGLTSYRVYRSSTPGGTFIDSTASDPNAADTRFDDPQAGTFYYLVSGVGPAGEGPK